MTIFFSIDSLVGKDFEAGLAKLKIIAEQKNEVAEPGSQIISTK